MKLTGHNSIAGSYSGSGSETFTSINPRNKTPGDTAFYNATNVEIDRAVSAAIPAFAETRLYSTARLADFLDTVADEVDALGDYLLHTADMETGLGLPRLTGERGRTTGQLRAFGNLLREGSYVEAIIDTALPDRTPLPRPDIRRMLFPIGPVAVFSASNFPFAFAVVGGDTASAFAAGCPVVVKAHPGHPATSELFAQAVNRAIEKQQFPKGFFSLIQGNTVEVGQQLVQHPGIEAVGFTGSLRAGRAIYNTAAARPKPIPVYAEMGSINPVIILPDAMTTRGESIADGLAASVTLGSGQFCTNPGLVLVVDNEETLQFIDGVKRKLESINPGILLNAAIERGLTHTVNQTQQHKAITVLTGASLADTEGYCYQNTVLMTSAAAFRNDRSLQVEHFGPVTLFVLCDSVDDLKQTVRMLEGNLTATIHAEDTEITQAAELATILREKVGRLIWNGFPTGVEVVSAMQHGGPYPATTAPATTSVGMTAIKRFMRPVAFQNMPHTMLPDALQDNNPLNIMRMVNGDYTRAQIT